MNPFSPLVSLVSSYYQARDQFGGIPIQPLMYGDNNSFNATEQIKSFSDGSVEKFRMLGGIKDKVGNVINKSSQFIENLDNNDVNNALNAAPGVIDVFKNTFDNAEIDKSVKAPKLVFDTEGQPIYNQEKFLGSNAEFKGDIKGTVGNSILKGGVSGAQAGFAIGGPWGAAIGAGAGLIGGVIGGSKRKKQLLKESMRRDEMASTQNNRFNRASEGFYKDQESDDYRSAVIGKKYLNS